MRYQRTAQRITSAVNCRPLKVDPAVSLLLDAVCLYLGLYSTRAATQGRNRTHIHAIFRGGYFRPERMVLFMNEGVIRAGQHVSGAFNRTVADERFVEIVTAGAKTILLTRLACMAMLHGSSAGFYRAASGGAGLDPVEEFMVEDWLAELEAKRQVEGIAEWLP